VFEGICVSVYLCCKCMYSYKTNVICDQVGKVRVCLSASMLTNMSPMVRLHLHFMNNTGAIMYAYTRTHTYKQNHIYIHVIMDVYQAFMNPCIAVCMNT